MGEVFLSKQIGPSGFEKLLVIKRILAQHHDKTDYLNMFLSEARLVAYLTHSNIIQIHEMGQIEGDYFIAMEYVRGKSLRDMIDGCRVRGTQLSLPHVIDLAIKLCDGLGYAHDARDIRGKSMNIIHRDINPHNILISYSGDLKLIDFGIAKSEMTSVHTATGTIKGKFVYMSPEQSAADPIDRRSDIFSLGIVLYEMLTGENPFVRQNVVLSLEAIQRHPVAPPSAKRADAGPLDEVLEKALQKRPEDRYQNCLEMRDDLREVLRAGSVTPAGKDIATFLTDLYADEIDEEDRLLAEADRATSPPVHAEPQTPSMRLPVPDAVDSSVPPRVRASSSAHPSAETRSLRSPEYRPEGNPITQAPFSDEEPTIGEELEDIAERSRLHTRQRKLASIPTAGGDVHTLIPPDEVAPGTGESFTEPGESGPSTREDRVPAEMAPPSASGLFPRPEPTADVPASALPRSSRPPLEAALSEPLPSRPKIPAFSRPLAETKELRRSDPPILANGSAHASTPVESPPASPGYEAEDSDLLPPLQGPTRRAAVVAGVLVFVLAVLVGFWGMQAVLGWWPSAKDPVPPITNEPAVLPEPPNEIVPVQDPPASPPSVEAAAAPVESTPVAVEPEVRPAPPPPREERPDRRAKPVRSRAFAPAPVREPTPPTPTPAPAPASRTPVAPPVTPPPEAPKPKEPAKPVAPEPESKLEITKPVSPVRLGLSTISVSGGSAQVVHAGRGLGSAPTSVVIRDTRGKIGLKSDDVEITLEYEVKPDGFAVRVDSQPWSIVKHNGISLGRTPRGPVAPARRHQLTFMRPGQETPLVLTVIWNPTSQ
jgi:serine/threonine protein kinase